MTLGLSQEQPPFSIEGDGYEELRDYLIRRFVDIDTSLKQSSKFPERKEMPYKPQTGDLHYFGDPADHNYDAAILVEGFWGLIDGTWTELGVGGAGVTDHGALTGLVPDDDHTQYALLIGRAGDQYLRGGIVAGEQLTLRGASSAPDTGIVEIESPVTFSYDTVSNTTPAQQFVARWPEAISTGAAAYIGGMLQTAANFNITTGVFIPAIFSDTNLYRVGAVPGFSAITFINELSVVQNNGNFNLPSALVANIGLVHSRTSVGTSTTAGTTGISFSPQTRATVNGAIMTKTAQTAVRCSPTYSTVAGSTTNLGIIRGLHCFNPAVALFQPGAGAETMGAYIGLDMENISFGGNVVKAAVRSAMTPGLTNTWLLLNNGNAHSDHGAGHIYFDDNAGIAYGGISNTSFDVWQTWNVNGYFRTFFFENADSLRWTNPDPDRFLFDNDGGNTAGEYNFNFFKGSFGAQTGANGNSFLQFPCPARATLVNGGWVDVSFSQAGNLTIDDTMSDVTMFNLASISLTSGAGSITGYITTFNVGMTTSGVTGVETSAIRPTGRIHHRGVMEIPPLEPAQITANQNNYSPATFNSMRQMWSIDSDGDYNITGILIPTSDNPADTQWIVNNGSFTITLTHEDSASTAANRFISPSGADYTLGPDESVALWHDPTADRWRILWGSAGNLLRTLHLSGDQFRKGTTAPTDVTIGTTPTVPALLFDATNELASLFHSLPVDIDGTKDVILHLQFSLSSVETNGDTCDFTCDYTAVTLTTAEGINKTSTQVTGQFTAVTGRLAVGDIYEMDITFPAGDATNPLANAEGIAFEIHLTNTTGVGDIHLLDGDFIYTALR